MRASNPVVELPLNLFVLPREPLRPAKTDSPAPGRPPPGAGIFLLLATTITLPSVISTAKSVHLLTILQAKGFALAAAVSLGALVGPSQVAARKVEILVARFHHPIWTKIAASSMVAAGLAAMWVGGSVVVLALVLYGAGIGLESIARGTLPLAVFGPERYPVVMGRIAIPSLIAQAAAPTIGALLLKTGELEGALAAFFAVAAGNALLAGSLYFAVLSPPARSGEGRGRQRLEHWHRSSPPRVQTKALRPAMIDRLTLARRTHCRTSVRIANLTGPLPRTATYAFASARRCFSEPPPRTGERTCC